MPKHKFVLPDFSKMCEEIAGKTDTVILSFSRGKDSIASWIILNEYFERIIPFHMAVVPHLRWVDRSLAYYEKVFGTKILRFMNGEPMQGMYNYWFQPFYRREAILELALGTRDWTYKQIFPLIRKEYDCPKAWGVTGERITDNSYTGGKLKRTNGVYRDVKVFHPIYDWSEEEVMDLIEANNIKLPPDYRMSYNSLHDMPTCRHLYGIRELFPEDYSKIENMFPLIGAHIARNEFRKLRGQ